MAAAAYPTRIGPGSCLRDGDDDDLGQPPLRIGEKVFWLGEEQPEPGVVKWIGLLPDVCSEWTAGVALENEVGSMNGTWAGRVLFSCKQNHGIVISVNGLIKADDFLGNAAVEDGKTTDRPFPLAEQNGHRGDPDGASRQPPNGAGSSSSGRYNRLERRSSSEDSWGDALDGSPTSDSPECEVGGSDVNGLAVKRLLKLLEISIGEGRLEEAATFARDLAQLKIQCCVTLNRRPANSDEASPIILNMFVEDKVSHHGPIPIRVSPSINVGELKNKIFHEFEFPVQIQRWILGKKLAMDDSASLSHFGITNDGCPVFLYLISPEDVSLKSSDLVWDNDRPKSSNRSRRSKIKKEIETSTSRPTSRVGNHGWTCTRCTMANAPSRPACSACKCEKPADYRLTVKCEEQTDEDSDARRKQREEEEKANAEAKELARLRNWQQYLRLDDQDLIFNQTAFECSVCFCETPPGEGVQLRDCLHLFCCDCLRNAVFHSDAASVGCPFRDDHYSCDSTLQEREIRALVPPDVFERHLQRSVVTAESQAANSFHCKTPDCQGWCLIEEKVNQFLCPACQHVSCITCRVNHEKMNCRQYQDQLDVLARTDDEARKTKEAVEMMLARGEAMNCPSCAVVIMKKWGCDWLACSICKSEICWVTKGPRWGPKGRGDTTAGCRCGINGIKCHQQCNYCH